MRKSTPKSFRLYSMVSDYKSWYVRYSNRSDGSVFASFLNLKGLIGKKMVHKSKQAIKPCLLNKKEPTGSRTERYCA